MAKRSVTVKELARLVDVDLEEALVRLWDAGLTDIATPDTILPAKHVATARRALGIAGARDVTRPSYWQAALGLPEAEFQHALEELGIDLRQNARRLPKGAVAKLKRYAKNRIGEAVPAVARSEAQKAAAPPLEWVSVGNERSDISLLDEDQVLAIHACLVSDFEEHEDPISPPGVRSIDLLSSAVARPHTSLGDAAKYPTVEMAAASLLHSLVLNHPFHNGNKRTALVAMLVTLDENRYRCTASEDDLFRLVLQVAQHSIVPPSPDSMSDREVLAIARWIRSNSRRSDNDERVVTWMRLLRILKSYGCWTDFGGGKGNRINIYREVEEPVRSLFGKKTRSRRVSSYARFGGDGSDVPRHTITRIRHDLELDDEHGVDSQIFYAMEIQPARDFIVTYRKTLLRLARL